VKRFVGDGARVLVERGVAGADVDVDDVLARFRRIYGGGLFGDTQPYAGILEAVAAVAPLAALVVATNKPGAFARPIVNRLLPGRFQAVVGPDDAKAHKPDRALLDHACAQVPGHGPLLCLVGDTKIDMDAAHNVGALGVFVLWGLRPEEAGHGDVVVEHPAQLGPALLRLLSSS
jgi:phosphoglycolate phosphatase